MSRSPDVRVEHLAQIRMSEPSPDLCLVQALRRWRVYEIKELQSDFRPCCPICSKPYVRLPGTEFVLKLVLIDRFASR